jgi:electron transport complex protein RnfD
MGSGEVPAYADMFLGNIAGCVGETSALALLIGAGYLLARRVIDWRIPGAYLGTVSVLSWILGPRGIFTGDPLAHLLAGGLLLGAFFMATDYVTSPVTKKGRLYMGIGCGILTVLIRLYGGFPEGVSYSILLMNLATPLIDKFTGPRVFGHAK